MSKFDHEKFVEELENKNDDGKSQAPMADHNSRNSVTVKTKAKLAILIFISIFMFFTGVIIGSFVTKFTDCKVTYLPLLRA